MEDNGLWPFGDKNSFHRSDPQAPPVVKSGDYSAETREWEKEEGVFVAPLSVHSVMISCRALHIALQMSVQRIQREGEREGTDKGRVP